ncbi:MAG TPA: class I SAM-dependent methyltransferase [Candidatus Acidoferrales bacterium]|nr:class I SAM-dependent methyltransferase [Candidatus Acidoferrales bacterium]
MIRNLFAKVSDTMAREGLLSAVRKTGQYVLSTVVYGRLRRRQRDELERQDGFDAKYGTDTSSLVPLEALDLTSENRPRAVLYWPSLQRTVEKMLGSLDIDHREFTFVDIGSGKGRVLMMASLYPYRRIVGVELSEKLHKVAERNIGLFHPAEQKCARIELICGDATRFAFPDDNLVLYFFDPFDAAVMEKVVSNLANSLRTHDRQVFVIYLHARCRTTFDCSPLFELVSESRRVGRQYMAIEYDHCTYQHRPATAKQFFAKR